MNLEELLEEREEICRLMIEADSDELEELEEQLQQIELEIDFQRGYYYGLEG